MNKNSITFILLLLVGAGIGTFVFYIKSHTPKYKWDTDYSRKSNQPYGLKYIYDLLKEEHHSVKSVSNYAYDGLDNSETNSNLIAIDSYIEFDSLNISYLLDYVKIGNKAFISTEDAPTYLLERILPSVGTIYGYDEYENKSININYAASDLPYPQKLNFQHQYLKKSMPRNWTGYFPSYFKKTFYDTTVVPVSYINDSIVNCFYISYGKGAFIIHSTPIVFTNYNMIQKNGFKNANNLFSYLNNGPIYWNEYQFINEENSGNSEGNPLQFLFSHYTLKTAWYLFLLSILIFILFRSKREQRIIPVIYKNKNTSIEYAKAIGSLYYQKKSHHNIGNELYNIFLADIRTRYHIVTSENKNELIEQISKRTEIAKENIEELFQLFSDVRHNVNATSKELVALYQAIENFNNIKK